jgi:signal transduction histidine kinase
MMHDFEKHSGTKVSLEMEGVEVYFSLEEQIIIYRIVQEAVNNVAKHAEAKHVTLTVKEGNGNVVIQIKDDGKGFDIIESQTKHITERGMGLAAIHERARMLGGTIEISSKENEGSHITLAIPITKSKGT